ncbi:MAG: hypothetical protein ACKVTZ_19400, partial [Bacteroidia bacterium]
MQNIFFYFIFFVLVKFSNAQGLSPSETPLPLSVGTKLSYEVTQGQEHYPFIVGLRKFSLAEKIITWEMPTKEKKGEVLMTSDAIKSGKRIVNYFGEPQMIFARKTAVWLSLALSQKVENKEAFELEIDKEALQTFTFEKENELILLFDGQPQLYTAYLYTNEKKDRKLLLLPIKEKCALIVGMDIGFQLA